MPQCRATPAARGLIAGAVLAAAALLAAQFLAAAPLQAMVYSTRFGTFDLGQVWHEQEGAFKGTWTRRGDTNVFDAHWTDDAGHEVQSEVTLESVVGRTVVLSRKDLGGNYTGTLSDDGRQVLDGTLSWAAGTHWQATIVSSTSGAGLRVDLTDGSRILGDPVTDGLDVRTAYGTVRVQWPSINTIRWKADGDSARFDMTNGDQVSGHVAQQQLDLKTSFGTVSIPLEHMKGLTVQEITTAMASGALPASVKPMATATSTAAAGAVKEPAKAPGIRLTLDLIDGSCLIGESPIDRFDVKTEHGDLKLKWEMIRFIEWKAGDGTGRFTLANGDQVSGQMGLEKLDLATLFGPVTIPVNRVRRLEFLGAAGIPFALTFDGKQNYVEVPTDPALDPTGAMTLECWFKTTVASNKVFVGKRQWEGGRPDLGYEIEVTEGILACYWENKDLRAAGGPKASDGQWHHAAMTWDGRKRRLFQDGRKVAEDEPGAAWTPSKATFRVGGADGDWDRLRFDGSVCQVRLSKVDRYGGKNFAPETHFTVDGDTVGYWDFSEGAGTTLHDKSGHGHDGKLIGNPLPSWGEDKPTAPQPPKDPKPEPGNDGRRGVQVIPDENDDDL